ncbi:hypothetical protein CcCBS67573_g06640 [Chytriomyces confervae]|uniref:3-deoxy-7-phosphoheptulonate synthase n=1 Tax=Chytriomyces confervae TaxID=246404 RepID=A0A507F3E7_9FUNG|nr:hypothetical protein CcCBS67573_g06640 [Chytriomyces confervae]
MQTQALVFQALQQQMLGQVNSLRKRLQMQPLDSIDSSLLSLPAVPETAVCSSSMDTVPSETEPPSRPTLESMPPEILDQIASCVSGQDILRLCHAVRYFKYISKAMFDFALPLQMQQPPRPVELWPRLNVRYIGKWTRTGQLRQLGIYSRILSQHGGYASLDDSCRVAGIVGALPASLEVWVDNVKRLHATDDFFSTIFNTKKDIRKLTLGSDFFSRCNSDQQTLKMTTKWLTKLSIRELRFARSAWVSGQILGVLHLTPMLSSLHLPGLRDCLGVALSECKSLRKLSVSKLFEGMKKSPEELIQQLLHVVDESKIQILEASPPFNKNDPVDDTRISGYDPIIAPQMIEFELPMTEVSKQTVVRGRRHARNILNGEDDRLLVVVGPCSIHDVDAAIEYAKRLTTLAETHKDTLCFIMRTYFEKPRTTVGWKGLINDPFIDNTYKINHGLRVARQLLNDITNLGLPVGFELLDTISPQYFSDVVSWGAIGARTTECQLHRELSSGVSFPVGFKGNDTCHVILRGSNKGPNYEQPYVTDIVKQLTSRKERPRVMVDASHGNSNKNHKNQSLVIADVARQISEGSTEIFGVMVESNIHEGNQKVPATGAKDLKYGVSITDACVDWETTVLMMDVLSKAVQTRRSKAVPAV